VTTTTIAVVNLKGGTSKTLASAQVAHALHELGARVLAVDSDPQQSLLRWHGLADWPIPCVALPSAKLHRNLPGIVGDRFTAVVIDTPPIGPSDEGADRRHGALIALSAARAATHVLIPVAPTPAEYDRLPAVRELLDEADALRPDEQPAAVVGVLLVRTVAGAASTGIYRDCMREDGWRVLAPEVRRLERYAQAHGEPVVGAGDSVFSDAVRELLGVAA
jgi:chromosome partitioning protein